MRRWLPAVVAATIGATAAVAGIPATLASPAPLVGTGAPPPVWRPVVRVDFDSSALPAGCTPAQGPSGVQAASWYDAEQVQVGGGHLRLGIAQKLNGNRPLAAGGIDCAALARTYGRFDIRAKVPREKGIDSVFMLWPEDGGDAESSRITLAASDVETAQVTNGYGAGSESAAVTGSYADGFHTYTMEWSPHGSRFLVDDRPIFTSARAYARNRWLGIGVSGGDVLVDRPDVGASMAEALLVDWFAISAYVPAGSPVPTTPPATPGPRPTPAPVSPSVVAAAAVDTPPADLPSAVAPASVERGLPTSVSVIAAVVAALLLGFAGLLVREALRAAGGWHRCTGARRHGRHTTHRRTG
jgi:hypothetical protein